jgi:O-6-methylguanine DNA methyltransferase
MAIKPTSRISTSSTPKSTLKNTTKPPTRIPSRHDPNPVPSSQAKPPNAVTVTPFQERVYTLLVQIPAGRVSTYALMARALDSSPRAVGGALRNNPFAPEVPCHRVVASDGFVGGFKVSISFDLGIWVG